MEADSSAPETKVPVKVPEPEEHAPPTLAEPASGPVAEMPGSLTGEQAQAEASETSAPAADSSAPNGIDVAPSASTEPAKPVEEAGAPQSGDLPVSNDSAKPPMTSAEDDAETGESSQKKGANGGNKRKSTSGIPEHKNKKLNKKKSMPKITHLDAQPGDYFFARLKSYPPWPSMICDEESLPTSLLSTRPVTTKKPDGTYNEPYADGGKKVNERTFPIMFLHTNEFAWIPNTDLADLNPDDCKDVVEKGKSKSLIAAYQVAGEGHDLAYFKNMLLEHAKAMEEDEAMKAEKAAEKAEKADKVAAKKKRKSEAKVEDDDVEMENADGATDAKKSSKKRKKSAVESDDEAPEKPPKTPKIKLTNKGTPATTEKKTKEKAAKPKKERKSKAAVEDEEMADAPEPEPEPVDPEEARKAREREVLFLRHKLQKGFLTRDQAPQEEDMPQMSNYIKKLENYEALEVSIIRTTKINKVLKALVKLNTIPKDDEFSFRQRSVELLGKWNKILGAEPEEKKDSPATNGVHDEPTAAPETSDKPAEPEDAKEEVPQPAPSTAAHTAPVVTDPPNSSDTGVLPEAPKTELPEVSKIDQAPASAEAAAEAQDVVKATE